MQVKAKLNNLRIAPRKSRLVAGLIKGLDAQKALDQLDITVKRSAPQIKKLLASAISSGENNYGLDKDNLYVFDVVVKAGPMLKRWMPKAYGRAGQILKRTSKLELILEERVEGKGRKTKEQMEEEKKKRIEQKKKIEKSQTEKPGKESETEKVEKAAKSETGKSKAKTGKQGGIVNKILRRKSM